MAEATRARILVYTPPATYRGDRWRQASSSFVLLATPSSSIQRQGLHRLLVKVCQALGQGLLEDPVGLVRSSTSGKVNKFVDRS
ncbi:hypothetical protein HJFPF1_07001 [Paramyrothecium foliicola]|nr:hypothetical protein HJFPF1_07001 [Paramyrothecium foliicola]